MKQFFIRLLIAVIVSFSGAPIVGASSLSTNTRITHTIEKENGDSYRSKPELSHANTMTPDGRLTVFTTEESNLVPGDTNGASDIFIYDRTTKKTERINLGKNGTQGNQDTHNATISADGRYIGFVTEATNTMGGERCVWAYGCAYAGVYDRQTRTINVASLDNNGNPLAVGVLYRPISEILPAVISGDGKWLLFMAFDDDSYYPDVFVRDLRANSTAQANISSSGYPGFGAFESSITTDGRFVAFSTTTSLVPEDKNDGADIYVRDMVQKKTTLVSKTPSTKQAANDWSSFPTISSSGSHVAYASRASDIVAADTNSVDDIFVYDMKTGTNKRISLAKDGGNANNLSYFPNINADGSLITYTSSATNIVRPNGPNRSVFLYYANVGITRAIMLPDTPNFSKYVSGRPIISGDGKAISYILSTYDPNDPIVSARNVYLNYDPVVHIPFYDGFIDLL